MFEIRTGMQQAMAESCVEATILPISNSIKLVAGSNRLDEFAC